jgi:hypothetical protein
MEEIQKINMREGKNKDNSIEREERQKQILALLNQPWLLLKKGGALGINGVKLFFRVLMFFSISNIILFNYATIRLFSTDFTFIKILVVLLVLLIGIVATVYSAYKTYQFVIIDTLRVIYESQVSFFQKISELVIDKVETALKGKVNLSANQLQNTLDFVKIIDSKFQNTPKVLKKGALLVLNRIPFVDMIIDLKESIQKGKKMEASVKLFDKMGLYQYPYLEKITQIGYGGC